MGRRIIPEYVSTAGALLDNRVPLVAFCSRCNESYPVDVGAVARVKGRSYSFVGKRAHCKVCGELVAFHAWPPSIWRINLSDG